MGCVVRSNYTMLLCVHDSKNAKNSHMCMYTRVHKALRAAEQEAQAAAERAQAAQAAAKQQHEVCLLCCSTAQGVLPHTRTQAASAALDQVKQQHAILQRQCEHVHEEMTAQREALEEEQVLPEASCVLCFSYQLFVLHVARCKHARRLRWTIDA